MTQLIPAAPGLKFLTTRQMIELDDYLATAAEKIRRSGQGAILPLVLNSRGLLTQFGEPVLLSKIQVREPA